MDIVKNSKRAMARKSSRLKDFNSDDLLEPVSVKPAKNVASAKKSASEFASSRLFMIYLSLSMLLLLVISILLSIILVSLKNEETRFFNTYKSISIQTTPTDAGIYLNNVYVGLSPVSLQNINTSMSPTLKVTKEGYKDYTLVLDPATVEPAYDINLVPTTTTMPVSTAPTENTKLISWSDFGITLSVPTEYTESLSLQKAKCKEVKDFVVDKTRCKADTDDLSYNAKVITIPVDATTKVTMTVSLPTNATNCKITPAKCTAKTVKKLETVKLIGQDVDVYESTVNNVKTTFVQPVLTTTGSDYNSFYLEFNNKVDYKSIFSKILKNA